MVFSQSIRKDTSHAKDRLVSAALLWSDSHHARGELTPPTSTPDSSSWENLFADDLSNAICPEGVWAWKDGALTATSDKCLWTKKQYQRFVLDLEFKTSRHSNSGVLVYGSDLDNWIPNSVEIQIADSYGKKPTSQGCCSVYGRLAPTKQLVKKPGQWNRLTVTCIDSMIYIMLNGEQILQMDMKHWTSAKENPDGTHIPGQLSTPLAQLPTKGHIGLQGLHAHSPTFYRNIKIKELD